MSQSIGSAALILKANTAQLQQGLQQAQQQVGGFMTRITSNVSLLAGGPWGAAVAGIRMVTDAVWGQMQAFMQNADAAAKQARVLGLNTSTLMGLQHAANLSGVNAEQLGAALRRLNMTTANAVAGNQQAQSAFAQLGLSMDQLRGQNLNEVLGAVADQMRNIQDPMQRARVAVQLFGEEAGPRLIPLLEGGRQGIADLVAEAQRLGVAIDDVEAGRIEAANDAMSRVQASIQGIFGKLAVALAPAIESIANILTEAITAVSPIIEGLGKLISLNFQMMMPAIKLVGAAIQGLMAIIGPVIDFAVGMIQGFHQAWMDIFAELQPLWEELKTWAMDTWNAIVEFFAPVGETFGSIVEWLESIGLSFTSFKDFALSAIQAVAVALSYILDVGKLVAGGVITYLITPIVTGFRMLMEVVASVVRRLASIPVVGRAFRGASQGLDNFVESVRRNENALRNTGRNLLNTRIGESRQAVDQFFDRIRQRNQQTRDEVARNNPIDPVRQQLLSDIATFENRMREEIATMGMSREEAELWRFAQRGATEEMLAGARALIERRRAMEEHNRLMQEGRQLEEQLRTPLEKFQDEMERLDRMLEEGAIGWETYERAVARAHEQLAQSTREEIKTPEIKIKDSREAVEAIIRHRLQREGVETHENRIQRLMQEQTETQRRQYQAALETNRLLRQRQEAEAV